MTPERKKLKRAQLIQRVRTVERMQSAAAASEAEATRTQKLSEVSSRQAEEAELQSQTRREAFAQSDMRLRKAEEGTRELVRSIVAGLEKG